RQPARRTATNAAAPISNAARSTPSAISSSARIAPTVLKPWPSTIVTRPSESAISAATPARRAWLRGAAGGPEERAGRDERCCLERRTAPSSHGCHRRAAAGGRPRGALAGSCWLDAGRALTHIHDHRVRFAFEGWAFRRCALVAGRVVVEAFFSETIA